ncbi:ComF family protein [Haloferula sp. A504]|uniref:ComF family protein n=1 Tax=Haloferula sp. A504 TaxID=3373601 RepID=UPI0031C50EE6|nr:ComF family protein [Verrucomicrobiaceae bacterium E54]
MRRVLRGIFGRALDLVYPGICHLCGEGVPGGRCLCRACGDELPRLRAPHCRICGQGFDGRIEAEFACPNCRDQSFAFEFARPALFRSDGAMTLVHDLKYGRRLELARELADLTVSAFSDPRLAEAHEQGWPLVPVPLHRRRHHWRQFNQSREIARPLGRRLGMPVLDLLRRIRPTETQTRLSRSQRQKNLRGAFAVRRGTVGGAGAVLVDDVFTTGSTAHECARVLRKAGFQKVIVVTVMRG